VVVTTRLTSSCSAPAVMRKYTWLGGTRSQGGITLSEDSQELSTITFTASLPNIQSAIQIHGGGDGFLVKLDVPLSDRVEMMKLACCDNRELQVTVKVGEAF
jgi:hypothetical protein